MAISTHAIVVLIGLVFPLYILLTYKKANDRLKNDKNYKVPYYKQLITIFWVLAGLVIASTFLDPSITLNFYPAFNTIGIILAVAILVYWMAQRQACKTRDRISENDAESLPKRSFTVLAAAMTFATVATGAVLWSL